LAGLYRADRTIISVNCLPGRVTSADRLAVGQSFYAILGSNPPQSAIVMKHAFFNVKFSGE